MKTTISDIYKGWTISVTAADNQCSHFSFDIIGPTGYSQHIPMVVSLSNGLWRELEK
jgi:hypothetical protein